MLVSFDVVSLFTTQLAVDVVRKRLASDETLETRNNLSVDEVIRILSECYIPYFQRQCF